MKIAIAGFQHETNSFAPGRADLNAFEMADTWPQLLEGEAVVTGTHGMNLPIAGAIDAAGDAHLIPLLWCAAEPSGPVTDDAFEQITARIIDGLTGATRLDGLYLDLHGAMVTQSYQDGEGELLRRIRAAMGEAFPIAVSLDLHANITAQMVRHATVITVYRSYPHLDMAQTGARAMRRLRQAIAGQEFHAGFRKANFLIPLHAQFTGGAPCEALYAALEDEAAAYRELALGFTAADIFDCGPSVLAYAESETRAAQMAASGLAALQAARDQFDTRLHAPSQAISKAMALQAESPVTLADVQDNPGAGGTSDTTGLLAAMIEAKLTRAVLGVLCDRDVAQRAHDLGVGATLSMPLGGKSGLPGQAAIHATWVVAHLSDGNVAYSGEMYGGGISTLGPSCLLRHASLDIRVVVSSQRSQCLDQALFTHFGIDLQKTRFIGVKSTVHFRADFGPISAQVINVVAPAAFRCQLDLGDYVNLRSGMAVL